jgi:hypothetical protein
MHAAAAAMLQPDSSTGSALYLLASLYNHSCEPSVNINFPASDGTAVFTAARRISVGEQLHISYTDTEQEVDVRQQYLAFSYGFHCNCPRCTDEVAELKKSNIARTCLGQLLVALSQRDAMPLVETLKRVGITPVRPGG